MLKLKKGDKVQVMIGKDRGKTATVDHLKDDAVYLPGINVAKRHVKKQGEVEGGIVEISKPIPASNVALVCPSCSKTTRVGFEMSKDGKTKNRICKKCHKTI